MTEIIRVSPEQTREKTMSGKAMLVCAYDNKSKFERNRLEGAISLADFRVKAPSLSKSQEVIFYCA